MILMVHADARRIPLADGSVQCCVTSPPYWGLRKYAGEQELVWPNGTHTQGIVLCNLGEHKWAEETRTINNDNGNGASTAAEMRFNKGSRYAQQITGTCTMCGAWRGAYGLEPTIEMYVAHTVEILREVRRVLRADGVAFWNIGDSYASTKAKDGYSSTGTDLGWKNTQSCKPPPGLKAKNLCLIPSRVALAAQADGWWVRSMIVWAKPNPMPESVTDRPTDAYEHIIMLTKSERYYWDQEAVKEPCSESTHARISQDLAGQVGSHRAHGGGKTNGPMKAVVAGSTRKLAEAGSGIKNNDSFDAAMAIMPTARNIRNVWTFATQPYSGAHFATFPEELPRRCILAASKVGDLILDPFGGSGTTGRVAIELRRNAILLDLAYGSDYAPLAAKRTVNVQLEAFA